MGHSSDLKVPANSESDTRAGDAIRSSSPPVHSRRPVDSGMDPPEHQAPEMEGPVLGDSMTSLLPPPASDQETPGVIMEAHNQLLQDIVHTMKNIKQVLVSTQQSDARVS
jgi:hypothetical protein